MNKLSERLNFGFLNIDKPQGPTSFSVSEFVKKSLGLKKTSHLGTLDPKVSGVLPIALGRACKLAGYFMNHEKTYVGILHTHKEQDIEALQKLINKNFVGKISQMPPHKSAVARKSREREVFFWNLIEASEDGKDYLFECKVEGGTYIRKLCSDLGEMIGGSHMDELRRTEAGFFNEKVTFNLKEFCDALNYYNNGDIESLDKMVYSAEELIKKRFPVVSVKKEAIKHLLTGKPLLKDYLAKGDVLKDLKEGDVFAVFSGSKFIEIASFSGKGEIIGKSEFVYN